MPTPETSIRLQKASEGSSTSVSEALSRLKEHLPVLRRRFWLLSGFSLLGFFLLLLCVVWTLIEGPAHGPLVWHKVLYPAILANLVSAHSLAGVLASFTHVLTGPLGLTLGMAFMLMGMAVGVTKATPMPMLGGLAMALFLHFGPPVLLGVVSAGDPGSAATTASIRDLSLSQLQRLEVEHADSKYALPLLWVLVQKEYFGTQGPHFAQEVTALDTAHFDRNPNLPASVTTARLLVLSRAARLPTEVAALQHAQAMAQHQKRETEQSLERATGASAGLFLISGSLALLLFRRNQRLGRKLAELCSNLVYGRSTTSLRRVAHCC